MALRRFLTYSARGLPRFNEQEVLSAMFDTSRASLLSAHPMQLNTLLEHLKTFDVSLLVSSDKLKVPSRAMRGRGPECRRGGAIESLRGLFSFQVRNNVGRRPHVFPYRGSATNKRLAVSVSYSWNRRTKMFVTGERLFGWV
jgi:hypothetical protein